MLLPIFIFQPPSPLSPPPPSQAATEKSELEGDIKRFIKDALKKQSAAFTKLLEEQNKNHEKQIKQLKQQLEHSFQQQIIQLSTLSSPITSTIVYDTDPKKTPTKSSNKPENKQTNQKYEPPKLSSSNISSHKHNTEKQQSKTDSTNNSKFKNAAAGSDSKKRADVFGDSIVRHVNPKKIWTQSKTSTRVNCYPGATVQEVREHAKIKLKHSGTPRGTAIIHAGSNDLLKQNKDPETIVEELLSFGDELMASGYSKVALSSLTPLYGFKEKVPEVNNILKQKCHMSDFFYFIDNHSINYRYDLAKDRVHLNYDGVWRLGKNMAGFLQRVGGQKE